MCVTISASYQVCEEAGLQKREAEIEACKCQLRNLQDELQFKVTAKFQAEKVAIILLKRKIHTHQVDVTHNRRLFANAIRHADKVKAEGKATTSTAAPAHLNTGTKPKKGCKSGVSATPVTGRACSFYSIEQCLQY